MCYTVKNRLNHGKPFPVEYIMRKKMKEKISKIISVLKKDGIKVAFGKISRYASGVLKKKLKIGYRTDFKKNEEFYETVINEALSGDFERVLVWRGSFGWNVPLFQRPQHIALATSRLKCLVFYEVTSMTDSTKAIEKQSENLYLVNFSNSFIYSMLFCKLEEIKAPKYLQFYSTDWTMSKEYVESFRQKGYGILYEYIDEINPHLAGTKTLPKNISEKYDCAMSSPDGVSVVVTADALLRDVVSKRGNENCVFAANGVDYDFFRDLSGDVELPEEFLDLKKSGKTLVGYYGAMANWIDYDLIEKICETGDFIFVLFGVRYDTSLDDSGILELENVKFMGAIDYKILKYYAAELDILTIPFVINDITRATSPLKLFEYMALHKPIVTTDMDECRKFSSPLIAKNKDEFIKYLYSASKLGNDESYVALCDKEAFENRWDAKAEKIVSLLENYEKNKRNGI